MERQKGGHLSNFFLFRFKSFCDYHAEEASLVLFRKTFAIKIIDAHIHLIQERLLCSHKAILEKVVGVTAYPKQLGKFLTKDETPRELGRREKLAVEQMLFKLIQVIHHLVG